MNSCLEIEYSEKIHSHDLDSNSEYKIHSNLESKNVINKITNFSGYFIENRGQIEMSEIRFYTQGGGIWFTNDGVWFDNDLNKKLSVNDTIHIHINGQDLEGYTFGIDSKEPRTDRSSRICNIDIK